MPVLTNSPTLGDLLKFESNGNYTREVVTLSGGTDYPLGAVLGRITASGTYRLSCIVGRDRLTAYHWFPQSTAAAGPKERQVTPTA